MKTELKTYTITICGKSYSICSDEDVALLEQAARKVEQAMNVIAEGSPSLSAEKRALLAALQIAHQVCAYETESAGTEQSVDRMLEVLGQSNL